MIGSLVRFRGTLNLFSYCDWESLSRNWASILPVVEQVSELAYSPLSIVIPAGLARARQQPTEGGYLPSTAEAKKISLPYAPHSILQGTAEYERYHPIRDCSIDS